MLRGIYYEWENGLFNEKDRYLITSPKIRTKLEEILNKISIDFTFLFVESYYASESTDAVLKSHYLDRLNCVIKENNIQKDENHIIFAKNSTSGEPLSAWMILHCLGHAVLTGDGPVGKRIADIVRHKSIKDIFCFHSAQTDNDAPIVDSGEIIFEIFAEYIWNGKIRFKNPKDVIEIKELEHSIDVALKMKSGTIVQDYYIPNEFVMKSIREKAENKCYS